MEKIKFYIDSVKNPNDIEYDLDVLAYRVGMNYYVFDFDGLKIQRIKTQFNINYIQVDPYDFIDKCLDENYAEALIPEVNQLTLWYSLDID